MRCGRRRAETAVQPLRAWDLLTDVAALDAAPFAEQVKPLNFMHPAQIDDFGLPLDLEDRSTFISSRGTRRNRVKRSGRPGTDDPGHDDFREFVVPVLQTMSLGELRRSSRLGFSALKEIRADRSQPRLRNRVVLTAVAVQEARARLAAAGIDVPRDDLATLHVFVERLDERVRTCPVCGEPVRNDRATHCGARCRKRASRTVRG